MKSILCYKSYFLLVVLAKTVLLNSQTIKASVDRNKIVIGEQIKLNITIDSLSLKKFSVPDWPQLSDTFNHFDVADRGKIDSSVLNGLNFYRQVLVITSFDSGRWEIPVLVAAFKDAESDNVIIRNTAPITIDVNPADISGIKGYHDVKDIIITPTSKKENNYTLLIVGLVFLVILIIGWRIITKRKTTPLIVKDELGIANPLEWALAQLQQLRNDQNEMKPTTKENYHRLYQICRTYFFNRVNKDVEHFTTQEWGVFLDNMGIGKELKTTFFKLLQKADDKRFAETSTDDEFNKAVDVTEEIIKKMESSTS